MLSTSTRKRAPGPDRVRALPPGRSGNPSMVHVLDQVLWQRDQEPRRAPWFQPADLARGRDPTIQAMDQVQKHLRAGESDVREPSLVVLAALEPVGGPWTKVRNQ